ncbi:MAG TPA: hypothetical protein VMU81_00025 [Acetobacteraceae bacterium]|nr:hypothetical protein [Acetobacteraceae bacterium]
MTAGNLLPADPRGFVWRTLFERSASQLRTQTAEYRRMAQTVLRPTALAELGMVADRLDPFAEQREREAGAAKP